MTDPPTATDACGSPSVQGRRSDQAPLDAPYPIGETLVLWTAVDSAGNRAQCPQVVRVLDREAPSLEPRLRHANRKPNQPLEIQLRAMDNCDPNPSVVIVDSVTRATYGPFPSGTWFKIWSRAKRGQHPVWRLTSKGVVELRLRGQAEAYSYDRDLNRSATLLLPHTN